MIRKCLEIYGSLDYAANNAGVAPTENVFRKCRLPIILRSFGTP
jgi:hypothetical protein